MGSAPRHGSRGHINGGRAVGFLARVGASRPGLGRRSFEVAFASPALHDVWPDVGMAGDFGSDVRRCPLGHWSGKESKSELSAAEMVDARCHRCVDVDRGSAY